MKAALHVPRRSGQDQRLILELLPADDGEPVRSEQVELFVGGKRACVIRCRPSAHLQLRGHSIQAWIEIDEGTEVQVEPLP